VLVSENGKEWGSPISKGKGHLGITTISFKPQSARFIKIIQTGQLDAAFSYWKDNILFASIGSLVLYGLLSLDQKDIRKV
jgi:hypothetical protein